ncbi:MAG: GTP cyclohydrolase II [Saprospiraceae bacterium]
MSIAKSVSALLPSDYGDYLIHSVESEFDSFPHIVLMSRKIPIIEPVLLRIHSECITGDVFGSLRCDCGYQLKKSMELIDEEGGILIYLRQEGRGIGLGNKLKAYNLQDGGMDTIEANHALGFATDERDYSPVLKILKDNKINAVRLLTNNPLKIDFLKNNQIKVEAVIPIVKPKDEFNEFYIKTKREKMGHFIPNEF